MKTNFGTPLSRSEMKYVTGGKLAANCSFSCACSATCSVNAHCSSSSCSGSDNQGGTCGDGYYSCASLCKANCNS